MTIQEEWYQQDNRFVMKCRYCKYWCMNIRALEGHMNDFHRIHKIKNEKEK